MRVESQFKGNERGVLLNIQTIKEEWFSNIKNDILSGMTVALALIPEAIAFSLIVGVSPMVGLYASFSIAVIIAFTGGRMGMISAATASTALLMVTLVKNHGVEYLFAATVLTGILQFIMGSLKLGRFITFVPQSVVTGFVNALAILIFLAQLPHFSGASWPLYAMVAGTLVMVYVLPRLTKAVPSPLVAIVVMTLVSILTGVHLETVGDMGHLVRQFPTFHLPMVPLTWNTLAVILPYSLPIAIVGSLETLLTATIVDEMTMTKSNKNREIQGQGIANFVTGFFGAMAGCAMIGQTVINVQSGGRKRLSTFVAGSFLIFLIVVLGPVVSKVPIAALIGVMFMVSINTFEWSSLRTLGKIPRSEALAMILTVVIVVSTSDLALGVLAGVIISALVFGWRIATLGVKTHLSTTGDKIYVISGQVFFGTMTHFIDLFDATNDPNRIVIDFTHSHVWDHSAVTGISKVIANYHQLNKTVSITGLNSESASLLQRSGLSSVMG